MSKPITNRKSNSSYAPANTPNTLAEITDDIIKNPPSELSERQRRIVNYRLRGMTQQAIAKLENVSQPFIVKELRKVKKVYKEQGRTIDSELVVGETISLHQEVERRAWEIFFLHKNEKPAAANKALDTILFARDKTIKLMMDLGVVKKVAVEHEHTLRAVPFLDTFKNASDEEKQATIANVIDLHHLSDLEEPEPPQLEAEIALAKLEEPEPPTEEDYE